MIFVFPPALDETAFLYHLGASYIRSYVLKHGVETHQVVTSEKMTVPDIVTKILEYSPRIVGFTCYDMNYAYVRIVTKALKKKDPSVTIVLGGPTSTFSDKTIMEHTPEIDICVRGEGEETVLELLKGIDLESVKGLTFRSDQGLISTPDRPFISGGVKGAELDVLPSPYLTKVIPLDSPIGILTSRGCVYQCTYCNFSLMFHHTIRYHSVERVTAELNLLAEHWNPRMGNVIIHDDIFSLDLKRAKLLCQKIIDEGIHLPLCLETRADNCDKELIELMRDAGVRMISFGMESASLTVLRAIKKAPGRESHFLKQIKSSVEWAHAAGITTMVNLIFGLPGEGLKEAEETLEFARELKSEVYGHNFLILFPQTELFRTRKEYGLDVYNSPFFLPYLTKYAYDVGKVNPLPDSEIHKNLYLQEKLYTDVLSYRIGRNQDKIEYCIVKEMPPLIEVSTWLEVHGVLPLCLVDMSEGITKKEGANRLESLVSHGVPVGSYYIVTDGNLLKLSTLRDIYIPVPVMPFHQYGEGYRILALENSEDVEALNQFAQSHIDGGNLVFPARDVPGTLISACRWGESLCPALSGGIAVVEGERVLPCYYGGCIGKIGDTLQELKEALTQILLKREKERGCSECPVNRECSHCLFPHPFTDTEFCTLRKEYREVPKLITIMEWLHRFSTNEGDTLTYRIHGGTPPLFYKGEIKTGINPHIRDTVKLLSCNGQPTAFDTEEFRSFSLGEELAAVLEAFQLSIEKESLISYLCETADIDRKEASKALDDAESLFKKWNFDYRS